MANELPHSASAQPTPVTMLRLVAAAKRLDLTYTFSAPHQTPDSFESSVESQLGLDPLEASTPDSAPHPDPHAGSTPSGDPDLVLRHEGVATTTVELDDTSPTTIILTLAVPGSLSFDSLPLLTAFCNEWNHDCLSPTLLLNIDALESVTMSGRTIIPAGHGLNDDQLDSALAHAASNISVLLGELHEHFPELLVGDNDDKDTIHEELPPEALESPADSDLPRPLTVSRIRDALASIGVTRVRVDESTGVAARINGIPCFFVLDNGPSFVVKGHWDPNLTAQDFTRLFLVCNDHNRHAGSVAAYCHSNPDGLQVRVDSATTVGHGLSDAQIIALLGMTIREVLTAVDAIATEAGLPSPVEWPDSSS